METKASLKAQIAAAKKAGKSMQTVGRLQYKLNQLNKDSKGTAVKTKTGVLKSKTGVVRQTDSSKKVRKPAVKKMTMDRNPNTVTKAATKVATKVAPKKVTNKVTGNSGSKRPMSSTKKVTPNSGSKGNIQPVKLNKITLASTKANSLSKQQKQEQIQAANNAQIAADNKAAAKKKAINNESNRVNDSIESRANKADTAMRQKLARNAYSTRLTQVDLAKLKQKQKVAAENKAAAKKAADKKAAAKKAADKKAAMIAADKKKQAATRKLSTQAKVEARQKDYRNNKTSPY